MRKGMIAATTAVIVLTAGCSHAPGDTADRTLRFYEHDTQQTNIDAGTAGVTPGDDFVWSGDLFDHRGGTRQGRAGGHCFTVSTAPDGAGDVMCSYGFVLSGGQIWTDGLYEAAALFSGKTLSAPVTGGTGAYRDARGEVTVQIPPEIPDQTDAKFVIRLSQP